MPHSLLIPNETQGLSWQNLRIALKNCVKTVAPLARVYSNWPLKYDVGDTINLLTSQLDNNKVHAWIISVSRANPYYEKAGGYNLYWDLNLRIWGFISYEPVLDESSQSIIEDECKKISQIIYLNQKHLGLDDTSALKSVGQLVWEDIDVAAFGDGNDVYVAQGNLEITLSEVFSLI